MSRNAQYFLFLSLVGMAAFVATALGSAREGDWPFTDAGSFNGVRNLSGPLGSLLAYAAFGLAGRFFAWVLPVFMLIAAAGVVTDRFAHSMRVVGKLAVAVLLATVFFSLVPVTARSPAVTGDFGHAVAGGLTAVIGEIGSSILVITCLLLLLVGQFGGISAGGGRVLVGVGRWAPIGAGLARRMVAAAWGRFSSWFRGRRTPPAVDPDPTAETSDSVGYAQAGAGADEAWLDIDPVITPPGEPPRRREPTVRTMPVKAPGREPVRTQPVKPKLAAAGKALEEAELPPMTILRAGGEEGAGFSADQLRSWSEVLEGKLGNYGIQGAVTAVNQGPLVTTFEFEPAPGVKIKDIVSRQDDLALAMRARSLRLIAPIPGRAVVGIEMPNPEPGAVYFHDVLAEIPERLRYSGIMIALGVDAVGKPYSINLCAAPHMLMAGTTGSGKSVSLNCFLASILFQYRPSDVRLLLIDPKMVEMSLYNGIPHLLHPVITDPRDAVKVFNFAIAEMERRNQLLHEGGVKNIESYNSKVALGRIGNGEPAEKLPYIVLVVDELADLVLTKGADFESLLSRLSNMARAVGIHMIVATQRPSVDVIDGKTKANFPTRIAFRVATKVDSRTILDTMGAEKLLGRGDMLYVDTKHPEALRLHGAWVTEEELETLVEHWKQYDFEEHRLELHEETAGGVAEIDKDDYFDNARDIVLQYRQGSTSLLQRKLHVGYARAARLLDQLEQAGVVGPPDGSKPREVLVTGEDVSMADVSDRPDTP